MTQKINLAGVTTGSRKIKIADLTVGSRGTGAILIAAATARKTKRGSDYLNVDVFDGVDHIYGNYWDWNGTNIPSKGLIVDIGYQVTEYNGTKQLTIQNMRTNNELTSADFVPNSGIDIAATYQDAIDTIELIHDEFLRDVCMHIYTEYKDLLLTAPGAKSVHHAYVGGTLVHSVNVAGIAKHIALQCNIANVDLCAAGGLLHDIGKLFTYKFNGALVDVTEDGNMFDHLYLGTKIVEDACISTMNNIHCSYEHAEFKTQQLCHIIASHHGKQEHGAIRPPMSVEAHIVHHADTIDANLEMILEAAKKRPSAKLTDKIFFLSNVPHINPFYTQEMFEE